MTSRRNACVADGVFGASSSGSNWRQIFAPSSDASAAAVSSQESRFDLGDGLKSLRHVFGVPRSRFFVGDDAEWGACSAPPLARALVGGG